MAAYPLSDEATFGIMDLAVAWEDLIFVAGAFGYFLVVVATALVPAVLLLAEVVRGAEVGAFEGMCEPTSRLVVGAFADHCVLSGYDLLSDVERLCGRE